MVQVLRPEIDLNREDFGQIMTKYRLNGIVSEPRLYGIWRHMKRCMKPRVWYTLSIVSCGEICVAATLGNGIDQLQSKWEAEGKLLEQYILDCLSMEMLQCLYRVVEHELKKHGRFIKEYVFLDFNLQNIHQMEAFIQQLHAEIDVNESGMMRPLKSVIYKGILTTESAEKCSTICKNCGRIDCPNRESLHIGNYREAGVLKYSYGYQRIFGQK